LNAKRLYAKVKKHKVGLDSIISGARQILPSAFTNQSPEILARIERSEIEAAERLDVDLPQVSLPENREFSEAEREDAVETVAAHRELGFEIFASYVSFHRTPPGGKWGIFYRQEGIRRLALLLMRDLGVDCTEARRLAFNLLRAHERFHFHFDVGALYDELVLKTPLYNAYSKEVYSKTFCTSDCFEESLANRALILSRPRAPWASYRDPLAKFVRDFCRNSPPGYRDYDRDPVDMKQRLLGQLRSGKVDATVIGPEQEWLAKFSGWRCSEYLITTSKFAAGRFVKVKRGGRIWIVHRSDPDPWPSMPHAHDYEQRQKLDLRSGEIFSLPGRNLIEKLRTKDLILLRDELSQRQPDLELPPLRA
jgi:hypothetical protein